MSSDESDSLRDTSSNSSDSDNDDASPFQAGSPASANTTIPLTPVVSSQSQQRDVLRENLREPVPGTSTGSASRIAPTTPSRMFNLPGSGKKRRKSGSGTKSPSTPKRRKKSSQIGSSTSSPGGTGEADDSGSDEDLDDNDDKNRRTSQHFSIHRIPVERLRKWLKLKQEGESEEEEEPGEEVLIEAIMRDVNERLSSQKKFEKIAAKIPTGNRFAEDAEEALFEFNVLFYRQNTTANNDIKAMYGNDEKSPYENLIWFYYRPGDIYAMTIKQTWQLVQVYSCCEFPCKISGRLTDTEGSTQEILFHLTGNISASQSVKKNPMRYDKLNSVVLNAIKPLRDDCSLYGLSEFTCTRKKDKVKVQIGLGYIRIKRRMDHQHLPEILDHFSNICEGKPTYTYPGNRPEEQMDDVPYLHGVFEGVEQKANQELCELVKRYVRNQDQELAKKFYLSDTFRDEFFNAEDYRMTCYKTPVAEFSGCPTLREVFKVIKEKWGSELTAATGSERLGREKTFENRIKKYIKIEYKAKGSAVPTSRPLLSLLEGEMQLVPFDEDMWKIMRKWMVVREDYYYQIHLKFLDLLGKGKGGIFKEARRAHLIKDWNIENVKTVKDYCKQYENEKSYYFPPPDANSAENNASGRMTSTNGSHFFDMMKVSRDVKGKYSFWLYYIFDRFDAGMRDASTRITKSLELLFPKDGSTSKDGSLLKKFWSHQTEKFETFFGNYESFCDAMTNNPKPMQIVVAFATQCQQLKSRALAGTASSQSGDDLPTLKREVKLKLVIPKDKFIELIHANVQLDELCEDLKISPQSNMINEDYFKLMATQVLERLVSRRYFTQIASNTEKFRYQVTGSFLKIRKYGTFKMSNDCNDHVTNNKYTVLFRKLQQLCTSGFPGFTHKLECFQIHESITKETRMKLHISEIL